MTLTRLRESRAPERRSAYTGAYSIVDPSAIPPPGLSGLMHAGVQVNQETILQVDVIFTAVRVLSNTVIRMGDLRAYTEKLSPDSIPYKVWLANQPPILTDTWGGRVFQYDGRNRTVWSMALFGECFWYIIERSKTRGALGSATALEVLHPAFMEVKTDPQGNVEYVYGTGSNKKTLDPGDVVHIPFKALPQARRALSPIKYASVCSSLAMAAYEFGSTWFSQGASPDFILSTEQKLGQEEVTRIAMKFVTEHGGLGNSHLPLVLDRGLKADKVMTSPDEAQYLNTLEYARSVIGSWFGIPAEWLGNALQRLTPAAPGSLEDETMRFAQNTLSGYTVPIEEATSGLLSGNVKAAFDDSKLNRPNAAAIAALVTALRQAQTASINDGRVRLLGWPPVAGGDDVIAPLASNTAPEQTTDQADDGPPPEPEGDASAARASRRSSAPVPPDLRDAVPGSPERCGTCRMFNEAEGVCWGYGNYPTVADNVCDAYSPETGAQP